MAPEHRTSTRVAWVAIIPLTVALIVFYVSGWNAVAPTLILILGALTVSTEILKWVVLELAERRWKEGYQVRGAALALAALGCLAWGVVSGIVAIHALTAPSAQRAALVAQAAQIEAQIDALPAPTPDMPAARIKAMSAETAARRADLTSRRDAVRAELAKLPASAAMPTIPLEAKAAVAILVEIIAFGVPFALRTPGAVQRQAPARAPAEREAPNPARDLARKRWGAARVA